MLMLGLSMQIKAKMIDIKRFVEGPDSGTWSLWFNAESCSLNFESKIFKAHD